MKRTPIKPSIVPLKRRPIARQPTKRKKDYQAELDAVTPELLKRADSRCELCAKRLQTGTWERHHRKRRSQGGQNVMSNVLVLCRGCHLWAHANPREAKLLGLLVSWWDDPRTVPVLSR